MEHYTDLAFRYIKMKKSRSILTVLGVSISVMLLYIILNLGWSYLLNERAYIRKNHDYEMVLFTENEEQIKNIGNDKRVKDYTVGRYYKYDYYSPVEYINAMYINTKNPYRMDALFEKLTSEYGVSGILNDDLAQLYLQGKDGDIMHVLILVYFMIAYIYAIFGVGIIRNSIQLTLFEQVKDFGNLRCIGSTKKQTEAVIFIQGALLELFGIIAGVILGSIGSVIGGALLGWDNTGFHILPIIFVVVAFMFDLYFSMKENSKLVTGMSPVSAIRGEYRIFMKKRNDKNKRLLKKKRIKEKKLNKHLPKFLTKDITFGKRKDKDHKKRSKEIKTKKRKTGLLGFVLIRLFGVEGEYAYKNLMRAPGRFLKVVTAMIFGVAAVMVLSCGVLSVLKYDEKIQDMYGYYPTFVSWDIGTADEWKDVAANIPYTKLNEEFKDQDTVTDAKRILMDTMYIEDYDDDMGCFFSDEYLKNMPYNDYINDIRQEIEKEERAGEDSLFSKYCLNNMESVCVIGYDEQDMARCENDLIAGTLDVSDDGIIVVENEYMIPSSFWENEDNSDIMFQPVELTKIYDYKLGDTIRLIDMAEYRKRLGDLISDEERKKIEEYERERDKLYSTNEGMVESWEEKAKEREEEYFSGMMYHFEPFSLKQYEKIDWMGIWDELNKGDYDFGYSVSDYCWCRFKLCIYCVGTPCIYIFGLCISVSPSGNKCCGVDIASMWCDIFTA